MSFEGRSVVGEVGGVVLICAVGAEGLKAALLGATERDRCQFGCLTS